MKRLNLKGASSDAILLTFIKLVTTALGLAITRLLAEYLSVYEYGTYSQIMLLVSTISSITMFGMMDGVNFFYAGKPAGEERESYIATIFALQCTFSTVAGCVVMAMEGPLCDYFENADAGKLLIFAALLPLLQNVMGMSQVLFVAVGKARLLAFRNLAVSLIRLVAVLIVVWVVQSAVVVLITSLLLDIGQIAFFWLILRKNNCRIRLQQVNPRLLAGILRYCAPMAIYIIISTLNRDLDKYFVSMVTDTETLALYANASKQLPFDILMASFCTVLVPHITRYISEKSNEKAAGLYKLFLEITYISTGVLCCAALAAAPQLMKLLYSNKYTEGLSIFCVYIFVDLLRFTNITLVLSAAGRTRRLMLVGAGSLLLNAVLNVVFYHWMGLIGPAVATLVITVGVGMLMLYYSAGIMGVGLSRLFDWKYLLLFVAESAVLTVLLNLVQQYLEKLDVHYFVILMFIAGLYAMIMALLNGKRLFRDMKRVNGVSHNA
ncbi:MAG: oligosaccharide flippase family protein [Clostridia bacterium]|nr:oligosaccharide flippase family protein [Clostridia bacterium]